MPETKGHSLEELDELLHARVPAWMASEYVCTGIGVLITGIEIGNEEAGHPDKKVVERVFKPQYIVVLREDPKVIKNSQ